MKNQQDGRFSYGKIHRYLYSEIYGTPVEDSKPVKQAHGHSHFRCMEPPSPATTSLTCQYKLLFAISGYQSTIRNIFFSGGAHRDGAILSRWPPKVRSHLGVNLKSELSSVCYVQLVFRIYEKLIG